MITDEQHEEAYLNTHTQDEGSAFFRVTPGLKRRRAVLAALPTTKPKAHL